MNRESTTDGRCLLSIVVPCYNEEQTLRPCIRSVLAAFASADDVEVEIVIVDDCSGDRSLQVANELARQHPEVVVQRHERNRGKGAALRTGFASASGDFVAIQDADLEYDPEDLIRLLGPLRAGKADVVYGSRYLSGGAHRVLYFWHSMGNRFLTFLSNMFTDLNLTDMETCYKVFRRDVIQGIPLQEDRFGFEPEVTAKIAARRLRIYEMGISYFGRTYEEGKKIGIRDGFRALYCILRYNAHDAPIGLQLAVYTVIGGIAAVFNLVMFLALYYAGMAVEFSAGIAFLSAAALNYVLCIYLLFRHRVKWNTPTEITVYGALILAMALVDIGLTKGMMTIGATAGVAKAFASLIGLVLNFLGRKFIVFPEAGRGPWRPSFIRSSNRASTRDQARTSSEGTEPGQDTLDDQGVAQEPVSG